MRFKIINSFSLGEKCLNESLNVRIEAFRCVRIKHLNNVFKYDIIEAIFIFTKMKNKYLQV